VVHLLQLLLGGLQSVRRRVELISLEALVGETDGERLVIFLYSASTSISIEVFRGSRTIFLFSGWVPQQTCGMFSACDEAASVVTERRVKGAKAWRRRGAAWRAAVRKSIVYVEKPNCRWGRMMGWR
jgi:hypothetical protein